MKKVILYAGLAFSTVIVTSAQNRKNEIDAGAGIWSTNQIVGTMSDIIISEMTNVKMVDGSYLGALHLGYRYALTNRLAVGAVLSYDQGTSSATSGSGKIGTFTSNYYTLAMEADYKFINRPGFKFYSLAGIGGSLLHQTYRPDGKGDDKSQSLTYLNYQITPVGLKFGRSFGIFAELGFGYKGILTAGLFTRF